MAEYDLTSQIIPYLDRHMVFPILEFHLNVSQLYERREIQEKKIELLKSTNMVDFAIDIYRDLYGHDEQPPLELTEKRQKIVDKVKEINERTKDIVRAIEDVSMKLQESNVKEKDYWATQERLLEEHGLSRDDINYVYESAKYLYECGNYEYTRDFLETFLKPTRKSDKNFLNALWGRLAAAILVQDHENVLSAFNSLKNYVEDNDSESQLRNPLQGLQHRAWLIHWTLFISFTHQKGKDIIIDLFLYTNTYLNTIQTVCPHVMRYLAAAVIINKKRKQYIKDLVKVIQQESYTYRDPLTEFLECLYINFDFDGAQTKLRECEKVVVNDFFLNGCAEEFMEHARQLIFETFCRIHECISISMLAEKLNMSEESAEQWIVDLIRNSHLQAKIDSKLGHVVMDTQVISPYQQIIERTKHLASRAQMMQNTIEKKLQAMNPEVNQWGS